MTAQKEKSSCSAQITMTADRVSTVKKCHCLVTMTAFRSDYRKSLPSDFIRIRLRIEQNCRLCLDIFISAIINDLFMTFTSRLKVDAKCVYQQ